MGSINEEITRIENAKSDIETAIEECGVDVPDNNLIDTYGNYIRQIPSAVFSGLNVGEIGGSDKYIESIKQENGKIGATLGGLASTTASGLMSTSDKIKLNGLQQEYSYYSPKYILYNDAQKYYKLISITPSTVGYGDSHLEFTILGRSNLKTDVRIFVRTVNNKKYISDINISVDGTQNLITAYKYRNTSSEQDTLEIWLKCSAYIGNRIFPKTYYNFGNIINHTWDVTTQYDSLPTDFTSEITIINRTKLPLAGGTMTGTINSNSVLPTANLTYNIGSSALSYNKIYTRYIDTYSGYDLKFMTGGTEHLRIQASDGTLIPFSTGTKDIGSSTLKFRNIYGNLKGNADTATKLGSSTVGSTNRPIYLNAGTPTVCNVGESFLTWGGANFAASWGPIDAAMIPELGANRLEYYPGSKIKIEYSTDNGSTWTDSALADTTKSQIFSSGQSIYLGGSNATKVDKSQYQTRITLTTASTLYSKLNKFAIRVSTSGSSNCWCSIDIRLQSNVESNTDTWVNVANQVTISGWSGWNIINIPNGFTTYGNQKATQYGEIRFTFGATHPSSSEHPGLTISRIKGFGGEGWTTPSNKALTGTIYTEQYDQRTVWPNTLYPSSNKTIDLGTSTRYWRNIYGANIYENGTLLSSKYAPISHTHNYLPLEGGAMTGPIAFNGNDVDRNVLRVNCTTGDASKTSYYGYTLKYLGSGSGINNALALYADNNTANEQNLATKWLNDGTMYSRSIIPHLNSTYDLGNSTLTWKNIYGTTIYENGTSLASKYATTSYVDSKIAGLVDSAPSTLNTLNELAAALGDDANFSTTVINLIGEKTTGPSESISENIAVFDGTSGKTLKDSGKKISDFATLNHTHDELKYASDTRDIATAPKDYAQTFKFVGIKTGTVVGLTDAFVSLIGCKGYFDNTGPKSWEFATGNTRLYARSGIWEADTWNSWNTLAYLSDIQPINITLQGYTKPSTTSAILQTDTLNQAIGKLEYKADVACNWINSVTGEDADTIINKWEEIVSFLDSVNETQDITEAFVTTTTTQTIRGQKTFAENIIITNSSENTPYIRFQCKNIDDNYNDYYVVGETNGLKFKYSSTDNIPNEMVSILPSGITAIAFKTTGGSSSQFVKGDGSLDANQYTTKDMFFNGTFNFLPLAGGIMTGMITLGGQNSSSSASSTSQILFGASGAKMTSNGNGNVVINPNSGTTGQIILTPGSSPSITVSGKKVLKENDLSIEQYPNNAGFKITLLGTDYEYLSPTFNDINVEQIATTSANVDKKPLLLGHENVNPDSNEYTGGCIGSSYASHNIFIQPSTGTLFTPYLNTSNLTTNRIVFTTSGSYKYIISYADNLQRDCTIMLPLVRGVGRLTFTKYDTTNPSATTGSLTKPVWVNEAGYIQECTYSLNANVDATVNTGTKDRFVYYSETNSLSTYTGDVGASNKPIYFNKGVPTAVQATSSTDTIYVMGSLNGGMHYGSNVTIRGGNSLYASGGFYESSDNRLKNFISDIDIDLEKLSQLPKKYFTWKSDESNNLNIGTSAQELQKLYPELVKEDEKGMLNVAYDKLSIIALKAIDKLYKKIKDLENKINNLNNGNV